MVNSNTTNVKVKPIKRNFFKDVGMNSNTTNVKVKQTIVGGGVALVGDSNTTNVKVKRKQIIELQTKYEKFKYNQC